MNHKNISGITRPIITVIFFVIALLTSPFALSAVHNISLTAETLPNGQLAYAMTGNEAVIPGPALFVKEGDSINVTLTNNTSTRVGFKVPGLPLPSSAKVKPGKTKSYSVKASKAGTYVYHGNMDGKELLGLFGALIVDKATGPLDRYVEANGNIVPVTQANLDKQFVLFMVGSTFWGTEISNDGTQKPLWANPNPGAVIDDIVRFHILSIGPGHTFHLHAHRWLKTGTSAVIDTKLMAEGSDTHSFTVKAGSGVGAGDWQYHCHLIAHMEAGMHGSFKVDPVGGDGASIVGASPYGNILLGARPSEPGLVTFEVTDEPASWFRSARGDAIVKLAGADIKTKSLEVIYPGSSVNFIMSDTNGVHTISSLLWPTGAHHMPLNQSSAYRGGAIVKLDTPGLYVFTCKVHPYMFGAVIVDDPKTGGLDLGNPATNYTIDLVTGITGLPTSSDLAVRLLKTFFIATSPTNWKDYSSGLWNVKFPKLPVRISGAPFGNIADDGNGYELALSVLNVQNEPLAVGNVPGTPGIGEVWVNTQFEKTAGKYKPGTTTVVDTTTWKVKRKVALPQINNNNPHNMWSSRDQSVIYQTQWFDNKLTMINREDGALIKNIQVGYSPSHVVTLPTSDDITIAINGENGIAVIPYGKTEVTKMMPTQAHGHTSANPHGHWVSADGSRIVTPNINTDDIGIYSANGDIQARTPTGQDPTTGKTLPGAHPIAIGMMPDSSKVYAANLLHHTLTVVNGHTGAWIKTINLIADYDPISGKIEDKDGNGVPAVGVLPIQSPVSPDGKAVVIASTGGQIVIVDTATDTIVKSLDCDPGCHGANFGAKQGGGYYAYVTTKFGNQLTVVDVDPNGDGDLTDAIIAGYVLLVDDENTAKDDVVSSLPGFGGQGVLAVPNVYNGWVQNLPAVWTEGLTAKQQNPIGK